MRLSIQIGDYLFGLIMIIHYHSGKQFRLTLPLELHFSHVNQITLWRMKMWRNLYKCNNTLLFCFGFTISEVYVTRSNYFSYFTGTNKN